jgi:hypothetical protein
MNITPQSYVGALLHATTAIKALLSATERTVNTLTMTGADKNPLVALSMGHLRTQASVGRSAIEVAEASLSIRRLSEVWPDMPTPRLKLTRYVALIGGGSISEGEYYSREAVQRYGVECRRTNSAPDDGHTLIVSLAIGLEAAVAKATAAFDRAESGTLSPHQLREAQAEAMQADDEAADYRARLFAAVQAHNALRELPLVQAVDARVPAKAPT